MSGFSKPAIETKRIHDTGTRAADCRNLSYHARWLPQAISKISRI